MLNISENFRAYYLYSFSIAILFMIYINQMPVLVIYVLVLIPSESIHVSVQQDHNERVEEIEQEPGVNHLHVRCLRQAVTHVDKHRSQH